MSMIHEHKPHPEQSIRSVNPTQFSMLPLDRVIFLIQRYEALRVDAETLPTAPYRPPLAYVEATLAQLRRQLIAREYEAVAA